MEPVIVDANERISSEVIDQDTLLKLCYTMLHELLALNRSMTEREQEQFRLKYSKFSIEFPNVFNMLVLHRQFYKKPFLKYL